jgi:hypothetical protein
VIGSNFREQWSAYQARIAKGVAVGGPPPHPALPALSLLLRSHATALGDISGFFAFSERAFEEVRSRTRDAIRVAEREAELAAARHSVGVAAAVARFRGRAVAATAASALSVLMRQASKPGSERARRQIAQLAAAMGTLDERVDHVQDLLAVAEALRAGNFDGRLRELRFALRSADFLQHETREQAEALDDAEDEVGAIEDELVALQRQAGLLPPAPPPAAPAPLLVRLASSGLRAAAAAAAAARAVRGGGGMRLQGGLRRLRTWLTRVPLRQGKVRPDDSGV